ncbi:MAG: hypothetical protein NTZ73_01685 [Candidatus Diapherotrites archaeon]|nr:hypothetical protein [Candidatus Diapherotrites archaeon]
MNKKFGLKFLFDPQFLFDLQFLALKIIGLLIATYFISNLYFTAITSTFANLEYLTYYWPFFTLEILAALIGLYLLFRQKKFPEMKIPEKQKNGNKKKK